MLTTINTEKLELSTQVVIEEAKRRGYQVDLLDEQDNFIRLRKHNKVEYVKQATRTSLDTYISPLIMENKEVTKQVLREHYINVPDGSVVQSVHGAEMLFSQYYEKSIVVKPKSTNFGIGITVLKNLQDIHILTDAVLHALQYDDYVIIEQFIVGSEYRFLVIGDETVAVLYREPANIVGDGRHTIAELVEEKNKDPLRGEGYIKPLEKIKLGQVELEFLAEQGLSGVAIPAQGEKIFLRENSNISTGGDSIDMTDDMPDFYKHIAVQAAKAVGARMCGADIIIDDITAEPNNERYSIIELNFNPALHIHNFPYRGMNRHVERKVLDLLDAKFSE